MSMHLANHLLLKSGYFQIILKFCEHSSSYFLVLLILEAKFLKFLGKRGYDIFLRHLLLVFVRVCFVVVSALSQIFKF